MKNLVIKSIFTLALFVTGFVLLLSVDWKIALGVFLFVFANNIQQDKK